MSEPQQPAPPMAVPDLALLKRWLQGQVSEPVALFGAPERPVAVGVWYATHLQIARLEHRHALPLVVLQTTFCSHPRRRRDVLPLLAQANQQLERGRWYLQREPLRLTYAMELPALQLDAARFDREWRRFYNEAVAHGIELTLRTRSMAYVEVLRARSKPVRKH